jgi:hypothetical protein
MRMNTSWLTVLAAVAVLTSAQIVRAITFGELDNGRHPNVGAVMVKAPYAEPFQYMSGTLVAPNLFLAAGHGTSEIEFGIASGWFSLDYAFVTFADDPYDESSWLPIKDVRTHPGYKPAKYDVDEDVWADAHGFGSINIEDVGVVILDEEVTDIEPAALPTVGFLDELKRARELKPETKILSVGYGTHETFPPPTVVEEPHSRELVFSDYRGINKRWLLLSMNVRLGNGGGGYGDSGGPKFWVDPLDGSEHLVAITSRGDPLCVAMDVSYRIDTSTALDFIEAVRAEFPCDEVP